MQEKRILMDEQAMMRAIRRISHEILERNKGLEHALILGIERARHLFSGAVYKLRLKLSKACILMWQLSMWLCTVMTERPRAKKGRRSR